MIVAVERELVELRGQLQERGYTMVSYPDYQGSIDAYIYTGKIPSELGNQQNDAIGNYVFSKPQGILMVNARNKTVSQIEEILRTRVYSPLF